LPVLGVYTPDTAIPDSARLQPQISDAEIERRIREDEVYTTEEVLAQLKDLLDV
jgi:hypothetical protein